MPIDPYSFSPRGAASAAPPVVSGGLSAQRGLKDILTEDEEPSSFESLFRFMGRPGFLVRTLLSGDLSGFLRNAASLTQEVATFPVGVMNHNLLPFGDYTRAEHRPEFSDLLQRWGVIKDPSRVSGGEKFALDLFGGIVTDPLTLVGGGGKTLGTTGAKVAGLSRSAARRELIGAVERGVAGKTGKVVAQEFQKEIAEGFSRVASRTSKAPGFEALGRLTSWEELDKLIPTLPSSGPGLNSVTASKIAEEIKGQAVERLFFNTLKAEKGEGAVRQGLTGRGIGDVTEESFSRLAAGDPKLAEGELQALLLRQSKAALIAPQPGSMDDSIAQVLGSAGPHGQMANVLRSQGNLKSLEVKLGQPFQVLFRPENEISVGKAVAKINDALSNLTPSSAQAVRNGMRDLGFSDAWSVPFLKRQFANFQNTLNFDSLPGSLDEWVRIGHDLPLSVADEGMEALVKRGMSPGGGLSFNPLWSDTLGKAAERVTGWHYKNGFVYVPWSDVASATAPGMVRNIAAKLGYQDMIDKNVFGLFTKAQRALVDRFNFGSATGVNKKAATAVTHLMRETDQESRAGKLQGLRRALEGFAESLPDGTPLPDVVGTARRATDATFKAEDSFHNSYRAWAEEGPQAIDRIVTQLDQALPRAPARVGSAKALSKSPPVGKVDDLVKLVRSLDSEIKDAPWNAKLTKESLASLVEMGAKSDLDSVKSAGKQAASLLKEWTRLDGPLVRATEAAKIGYKLMDAALENAAKVIPQATRAASLVESMRLNQTLRAETTAALRTLRKLKDSVPGGNTARLKGVGTALEVRLQELADQSKQIAKQLRAEGAGKSNVAWLKSLEDANKAIRMAEIDVKASTRLANTFDSKLRAAFTARNNDLGKAVQASARTLLAGRLTQGIVDDVMQGLDPKFRPLIEKWVNFSQGEMRKIPPFMRYKAKDPMALASGNPRADAYPAWQAIDHANPFYLPHQATPKLVEAMINPRIPSDVKTRLMNHFEQARTLPTSRAFLEKMGEVADDLGLEGMSEELVQKDFRALTLQRMMAFEDTKALQKLYQGVIKIAGKEGGSWDTYKTFLDGALAPVGPRKNVFLKFLSGGKFEIELGETVTERSAKIVTHLNRSADSPDFAKIVTRGGVSYMQIQWPGLNALYKPALTSIPTNLRFRVRNMLAAPIQAMFHPEIGFWGVEPILKIFRNDGLVRWGIQHFSKGKSDGWSGPLLKDVTSESLKAMSEPQRMSWAVSTTVRAMTATSGAERIAARAALEKLSDRIGPYAWPQALDVLDQVLGRRFDPTDLKDGIENMVDLFQDINKPMHDNPNRIGKVVRGLRKFVDFGMQISNEQEAAVRAQTALKLMEKGKSPVEIVSEVNRLQIDYSVQSEVERWVRAVVPFARYMIGATRWTADMFSNPSGAGKGVIGRATSLQGLGLAQRSLSGTGEGETSILPRHAKETLALPLPWKDLEGNRQFLTSLGFPQEVVASMLALTGGRRESLAHTALGGLQPALKLPLEWGTNRNFFFGTEWGEYRKAPVSLRPFASEVPGPNDSVRYEVPGAVNELVNASPLSGIDSTLNRLADDRQPIGLRLLNAITGFRVQSVDEEAELQRKIASFLKSRVRSGQVGELEVFFSRLKDEDVPEEVKQVLDALAQVRAEKRRNKKEAP